jgi:hypothetical protein
VMTKECHADPLGEASTAHRHEPRRRHQATFAQNETPLSVSVGDDEFCIFACTNMSPSYSGEQSLSI